MSIDFAALESAIEIVRATKTGIVGIAAINDVLNALNFYRSHAAHLESELLREQQFSAAVCSQIAPNRIPKREAVAA